MSADEDMRNGFKQWADSNGYEITDNTTHLLRYAHLLINDYLTQCTLPHHDTTTAQKEALYEQAYFWHTSSIAPMSEHVQTHGKVVTSSTLLGASLTYADTGTQRVANRENAATQLCPAARLILRLAGIRPTQPNVIG